MTTERKCPKCGGYLQLAEQAVGYWKKSGIRLIRYCKTPCCLYREVVG